MNVPPLSLCYYPFSLYQSAVLLFCLSHYFRKKEKEVKPQCTQKLPVRVITGKFLFLLKMAEHRNRNVIIPVTWLAKWGDKPLIFLEDLNSVSLISVKTRLGFPGGPAVKNLPANTGDQGSIRGLGRVHVPSVHGILQARELGVGCHVLLQGIFLAQGSKPGLLHCREILYQLSYEGSPREVTAMRSPHSTTRNWPLLTATGESWHSATKTQNSPKQVQLKRN